MTGCRYGRPGLETSGKQSMKSERTPLRPEMAVSIDDRPARHLFRHAAEACRARQDLDVHGYAHLRPEDFAARALGEDGGRAFEALRASWDRLPPDSYMNDGGRYRRRRHAVFAVQGGDVWQLPYRPHFQSRAYNALNGGIYRRYAEIEPGIIDNPVLQNCLRAALDSLDSPDAGNCWFVEAHQFRIIARPGEEGRPTPEGVHRDGVERVFMALMTRDNVGGGLSRIYGADGELLQELCLERPLEAMLVDDVAVRHGVTPIRVLDPAREGVRDMLVITARRAAADPNLPSFEGNRSQ